jgi:carboxymethylenebutenolidase
MPAPMLDAADGTGRFTCHLRHPEARPAGAVVLLQEIFGVNANMLALADWVAEIGFVALVPDLFWRQQPGVQLDPDGGQPQWEQAFALMRGFNQEKGLDDIRTAIAAARTVEGANGRVATMGFCLGGRMAFKAACHTDAECHVSYYGVGLEALVGEPLRAPALLHIAERDKFVPPEAREAILAGLAGDPLATIHVYPGVDHAFARLGGHSWDARAATIANGRTAEFLVAHVG